MCAQHLRKAGHMWALQLIFRNLTSVSKSLLFSYAVSPTSRHTGQHIVSFPPAWRSFVWRKTSVHSANALQHHGGCTEIAARLCNPTVPLFESAFQAHWKKQATEWNKACENRQHIEADVICMTVDTGACFSDIAENKSLKGNENKHLLITFFVFSENISFAAILINEICSNNYFFIFKERPFQVNVVLSPNSEKGGRNVLLLFNSTLFSAY